MPQTIPQGSIAEAPVAAQRELKALLTSAGLVPLADTGWIRITGPDRVRWLNGMVTNSIGDLAAGQGCYNFILNAQGRIQGDGNAFAEPDYLLFETGLSQVPPLMALLDRFIIMDDVELSDITSSRHGLLIAGPRAPELLSSLDLLNKGATSSLPGHLEASNTQHAPPDTRYPKPDTQDPKPGIHAAPLLTHVTRQTTNLIIVHAYSPLVPRFEIWSDEPTIAALRTELETQGATLCTPAALNLLRICEGTPLFGTDIRDRDLPQETGAARALHFSKGCYLGQEIVERIRSRGNVHRTFTGFHLHGADASAGAVVTLDGKTVGELTSVAPGAGGDAQLALGYIRREALAQSKSSLYEGGTATPASLPFQIAEIL